MASEFVTLATAKELCREKIGRLPRCGREVCVFEGTVYRSIRNVDDRIISGEFLVSVWLENSAGNYRTRDSYSLDPIDWYSR